MSASQTLAADGPRPARTAPPRLFHTVATAVLLVLMFLGFQQFYVHGRAYPGRELAPPIRTLLIVHGAGMTTWMLLALVQSALIAGRRHKVHMTLGWLTVAVVAITVPVGWKLGIESARIAPPDLRIWGQTAKAFMIVPIVSITIFAAFVAAGVAFRKRAEIHRPMMLCASLTAMPAAVSRIDFLNDFYLGTVWERAFGAFFMTLVVGGILLAVRCASTRKLDRWFAAGYATLVVTSWAITQLAPTAAWDAVASFLLG